MKKDGGVTFGPKTNKTYLLGLSIVLTDMPQRRKGVDETLDGRGADAGEVAGKGFRAVGLLPRGLVDHAAHEGDLVGEGVRPREGRGFSGRRADVGRKAEIGLHGGAAG